VAGTERQHFGKRLFVHVRKRVEQLPEIAADDHVLRHALREHRELGQRGELLERAEFERVALQRREGDGEIFRDAELGEIAQDRILALGGRLRLGHHVAVRRVERQGLAQDVDEPVDQLLLLPLEQHHLHDLLVAEIDVLRRGLLLALDRPVRVIEILGQAVDRRVDHDRGRKGAPHFIPILRRRFGGVHEFGWVVGFYNGQERTC